MAEEQVAGESKASGPETDAGVVRRDFEPPETARAFAARATDLVALRDTVVDAAAVNGPLWVTYLGFLFYLATAAEAVTHEDLFSENGVKLPFLGIELPLTSFFALGPALFLVMHAYILLHFVVFADKVRTFHRELEVQICGEAGGIRERLREQLPNNIFIQFLAGPRSIRNGGVGWMLWLVAWVSLVFAPLVMLTLFQLRFLPYHAEAITWWHRIALLIDAGLLIWLWPAISSAGSSDLGSMRRQHLVRWSFRATVCLPVAFVFLVATFPGETLHTALPTIRFIPEKIFVPDGPPDERLVSLHELLLNGGVDLVARRPRSVFPNVLVLPDLDAIDRAKYDTDEKIIAARQTISLRGRHLEGAILINADLRGADLTGAFMQEAQLSEADLRGAHLDSAERNIAAQDIDHTRVLGEEGKTQLQRASLSRAHLGGASLDSAQLQGADLWSAELQGVWFGQADLTGATLQDANLEGASFENVQLLGTMLQRAHLGGAIFKQSRIQGASFQGAHLEGAYVTDSCVWRANLDDAMVAFARVTRPQAESAYPSKEGDKSTDECDWSASRFADLLVDMRRMLPAGKSNERIVSELEARLNPAPPRNEDRVAAQVWTNLADRHPGDGEFYRARAAAWIAAGCTSSGGAYVMHNLIAYRIQQSMKWQLDVVNAFLDPKKCFPSVHLTEKDRAQLVTLRDKWLAQ